MVNGDVDMIAMVSDVCAMIFEVNLVGTNYGGWWIDIGATRHVCDDKSMFHSFRAVNNGKKLYIGNSATTDIKGEGDVVLKMTSEKELILKLKSKMRNENLGLLKDANPKGVFVIVDKYEHKYAESYNDL
ncbi:hypothetical protein Tco_0291336 [Tanacetum coccineum]